MKAHIRNGSFAFTIFSGLVSAPARAGEFPGEAAPSGTTERFGGRGELAISGATQLSLVHSWLSSPSGTEPMWGDTTMLSATPSVDYFVLDGLSLGARFSYLRYQTGMQGFNELSIGPSVGYNLPLGDGFSVWPNVYATWGKTWGGGEFTDQTVAIGGSAPLLYHPAAHFFVGFGPVFKGTLLHAVSSSSLGNADAARVNDLGFAATVGGWLAL
jgi:hypothetical protein